MIDETWIVRNVEGYVLPYDEAERYMERSVAAWMLKARQARAAFSAGIDTDFHQYQIGVRAGMARHFNHKLLAVRRHRRLVGYQAALL